MGTWYHSLAGGDDLICVERETTMSTAWTSRYAQRTKGMRSSAIRELL
jgi:hypothetical protein